MQNTANYKFKKPENTDLYNVQDFSDNMDAIDTALKGIVDGTTTVGNANKLGGKGASEYVLVDGSRSTLNQVSDLNDFLTGVGLFRDGALNIPHGTGYWLIIAGGLVGTGVQLAIDLFNNESIKMRNCASGTWGVWGDVNVGLANYLPKSGGTIGNGTSIVPLTLKGVDKEVYQKFTNHNDELMGYLGFKGKDTPVFRDNTYTDRELLHTGNSAKVLVQSTPLTAEGSVRIW